MADLDIVIRNGTVATAADVVRCDVGIRDGRVVALADKLPAGVREFDASDKFVLPGGIDSHCHIEQQSSMGRHVRRRLPLGHHLRRIRRDDDHHSVRGSASRGQSLREVVDGRITRAHDPKAVVDYAFHLIISDPDRAGSRPRAARADRGRLHSSFKVYMTYDALQPRRSTRCCDVLSRSRAARALMTMVHAENLRDDPLDLRPPAPAADYRAAQIPRRQPPEARRG